MTRIHPLVLLLLLPTVSLFSGCEGCDFSFGPIQVVVSWHPAERPATVEICREDDACQVLSSASADTGVATSGRVQTAVGWQGYTVCRHPALLITVDAEGCEPLVIERERQAPKGEVRGTITFDVDLDCTS